MSVCVSLALLVVCGALSGCESKSVRPDKVEVVNDDIDLGGEVEPDLVTGGPSARARLKSGASFESLRVRDAHIVFTLIQPEGLLVTEDFECLEQDKAPEYFLEAMACWHAEYGWLDVRHCVHDGLTGQQVYPWSAPSSSPPGLLVELDGSGEVCEREQMKSGFSALSRTKLSPWTAPLWVMHDGTTSDRSSPCALTQESAAKSRDWAKARLAELRPQLGSLLGEKAATSCDAALFDDSGQVLPWVLAQLASPDEEVDITASGILSFPGAAAHRIEAVRSLTLRRGRSSEECALSLVWSEKDGVWSLLGLNESAHFSSTRPFGEGALDISTATCSDLNGDGSPELWFHSGSETEGGYNLVELSSDEPRWMFSRYTGD